MFDEQSSQTWYARTSFYGTLQDESVKGIRVRKGNILIGEEPRIIEYAQTETAPAVEATSTVVLSEATLISKTETEQVNHTELVAALDILIGTQHQLSTRYKALNLQTNITIEQKKVLERVFDILCSDAGQDANFLVSKIIREFVPKTAAATRGNA